MVRRIRTEETFQESDEHFRYLSEAAFEAIIIHKQGMLLEANEQFYETFGYESHELLGKQIIQLIVAPESIETVMRQISTGATAPYEAIGVKRDGTRFSMEISAKPMEYNGSIVRVGAIRDISERKKTEEALNCSAEPSA